MTAFQAITMTQALKRATDRTPADVGFTNMLAGEILKVRSALAGREDFVKESGLAILNIGAIADLEHVPSPYIKKIKTGLFSIFSESVSPSMQQWANGEARKIIGEKLDIIGRDLKKDPGEVAQNGIYTDASREKTIYHSLRGEAFLQEMSPAQLKSIAQNGVSFAVERALTKAAAPDHTGVSKIVDHYTQENITQDQRKVLTQVVQQMANSVIANFEKARTLTPNPVSEHAAPAGL